jgi:hypothetical protein
MVRDVAVACRPDVDWRQGTSTAVVSEEQFVIMSQRSHQRTYLDNT